MLRSANKRHQNMHSKEHPLLVFEHLMPIADTTTGAADVGSNVTISTVSLLTFLTIVIIWCSLEYLCMIAAIRASPAADLQLSMAK